jgi:PAS domain S-box-containing protein
LTTPALDNETRLRLALSSGNLAIWEVDLATGKVVSSPELNRLYGFPDDATPSLDEYRARYAPGESDRLREIGEKAVARGDQRLDVEVKHLLPDGTIRWLLIRAQVMSGEESWGGRILGVVIDVTPSKLAEEELRKSEQRLRLSQDAAGISSLELDVESGDVIGSDRFWELWGLKPRHSVHISELEKLVLPEFSNTRSTETTRRDGTSTPRVEYQIRRADNGEVRWLARHIEFVHSPDGKPAKMFGVMQDITAQKSAEQRQLLLTHELEHRIKNILATVGAIAAQTMRSGDLVTARENFMKRLSALAEAHNLLTETQWTNASMTGVIRSALSPHDPNHRIHVSGDDLRLSPRMALSLALAVNELATNAMKYGALSVEEGQVDLSWTVHPDNSSDDQLVWLWTEQNGPVVVPPKRRGFGSVLIEKVLATDFGGHVQVDYNPTGVVAKLVVPLSNFPAPSFSR